MSNAPSLDMPDGDREQVAVIYDEVVTVSGGWTIGREVRSAILTSLLHDASQGRLDPFVSRERALAAAARTRDEARSMPT